MKDCEVMMDGNMGPGGTRISRLIELAGCTASPLGSDGRLLMGPVDYKNQEEDVLGLIVIDICNM
jgi:hypothetical protein